ncbi:MAG: DUF2235 domain-containing protein [Myxococcota bacterium]
MPPKNIVICSDGTGNTAVKGRGTNVFKVFEAIDTQAPTPRPYAQTPPQQITIYDDGVGTQKWRPAKLLTGAFGLGLKRNVLQLYIELARVYEDGDRIYLFGFSRGAFTVRTVAGLVGRKGIIKRTPTKSSAQNTPTWLRGPIAKCVRGRRCVDEPTKAETDLGGSASTHEQERAIPELGERELQLRAEAAYRDLRDTDLGKGLVQWFLSFFPIWCPRVDYCPGEFHTDREVEFIGVWDTVEAVGFPVAFVANLWNELIYRFKFPDRTLSKAVKRAAHALAIDDQRLSFHPTLWDEREEAGTGDEIPSGLIRTPVHAVGRALRNVREWLGNRWIAVRAMFEDEYSSNPNPRAEEQTVDSDELAAVSEEPRPAGDPRIRQVWFAGVHSNVGGGYPKQGMSLVALEWMLREATRPAPERIPSHERLRLRPGALAEIATRKNVADTLYDSRAGASAIYRFSPRPIPRLCSRSGAPVRIHWTALHRAAALRPRAYAPGNLPRCFEVVGTRNEGPLPADAPALGDIVLQRSESGSLFPKARRLSFWRQVVQHSFYVGLLITLLGANRGRVLKLELCGIERLLIPLAELGKRWADALCVPVRAFAESQILGTGMISGVFRWLGRLLDGVVGTLPGGEMLRTYVVSPVVESYGFTGLLLLVSLTVLLASGYLRRRSLTIWSGEWRRLSVPR